MKKVLSFVLVLAMILGSVSVAFAGGPDNVKWDSKAFVDAPENGVATYLKLIGVLDGYEDGTVKAENTLTRAEAVTMLVRALGLDTLGKVQVKTVFKDVPATHWASGYVAVANQKGFADGVGNNNFDPDAKLTMDQAIAMILKVLGYQDKYLQGTWPTNVEVAAYGIKLLEKVNGQALTVGAQNATRQDFFNLLYNALEQKLVGWNKTVEAFVPVDALGQITTGLYGTGNPVYLKNKMAKYVAKSSIAVPNWTVSAQDVADKKAPAEYVGKNIDVLKYAVGSTSLAGIWSVNSKTVEGTFAANYSNSKAVTFAGISGYTGYSNPVKLVNGADATDFSAFTSKAAVKAEFLYNAAGVATTLCSISTWNVNAVEKVTSAQAALLAAENYKKFMNRQDWLGELGAKLQADKKTYGLDATKPVIVEGAVDKLSDIKENDIVELYYYGNDTDKTIAKVVVTRNVVTGTMSDYSKKNVTYTVAGKEYKIATPYYVNVDVLEFGNNIINLENALNVTSYSLYLNAAGDIAFAEYTTEKAVAAKARYAFVLEADYEAAYTEKTVVAGSVFNLVTDAYIRLLPLDTMVEEDYHLISTAATGLDKFFKADGTWKDGKPVAAQLVAFTAKDGKLATLTTDTDLNTVADNEVVTFSAVGFTAPTSANNRLYAADAKAYLFPAAEAAQATAASYAVKAAADLAKATSEGIMYVTNAAGLVTAVIVESVAPATKSKAVTAAAIVDLTGTKLAYVQAGSDTVELLTITNAAYKATLTDLAKNVLYKITYANGVVVKADALDKVEHWTTATAFNASIKKFVAADLAYANGILYDDTTPIVRLLNGKFMVEDKYGYLSTVAEEDIDATLAKAKYLDIYKAYQDDFFDVVVIRTVYDNPV